MTTETDLQNAVTAINNLHDVVQNNLNTLTSATTTATTQATNASNSASAASSSQTAAASSATAAATSATNAANSATTATNQATAAASSATTATGQATAAANSASSAASSAATATAAAVTVGVPVLQTLTDEPNIIWDTSKGRYATVTLGGNRTIYASNIQAGQEYKLILFQDATGSRTISFDVNFKWISDTAPTISTGANTMTVLSFVSDGARLFGRVDQSYDAYNPSVFANFAAPKADYSTLSTLSSMPTGGSISRAGNAMYYDSTGQLTYAPNNLLTYSQDFRNTATAGSSRPWLWDGSTTVVSNVSGVSAPDGTETATRVSGFSTSDGDIGLRQNVTVSPVNLIGSIYVRGEGSDIGKKVLLRAKRLGGTFVTTDAEITLTASWQRLSVNHTMLSDNTGVQLILSGAAASNQASSCLVWGAQLEAVTYQTTPSTYVATTSSAYYGPRFDYDPSTLAAKGLLIEESRANTLNNSNGFSTASWTTGSASLSGTTAGPDGVSTSGQGLLAAAATTAEHYVYQPQSGLTANSNYALSLYVKADTTSYVYLMFGSGSGYWATAIFDLTTQATTTASQTAGGATSGTVVSTSKQYVGNGWYRIGLVASVNKTNPNCFVGHASAATGNTIDAYGVPTFTSVGTERFYIYGAQLEAASFPSSYIPTTSASVTRAAETFSISGYSANLINATYIDEGTGVTSMQPYNAGVAPSPAFSWLTALRVYTNAYAGNIATPSWLSFSRTGNAMVTDSTGKLTYAPNNLLLNTATLSTQSVTTAAANYVLSFKGTGSVALSGAYSGSLAGTGASNRVSLAFTSTAASLTLTVTGTVTEAQLEIVTYETQPGPYVANTSSAYYGPRYDFDASTTPATPRGLLIEESRKNEVTYSQAFDNAAWAKFRCSVSASAGIAPDATNTALATVQTAGQTTAGLVSNSTASLAGSVSITTSVYAKAKEKTFLVLGTDAADAIQVNTYSYFNLSTGTVGTVGSGQTATIQSVGNGWYRCTIVATTRSAGGVVTPIFGGADTNGSFTVTDSGGVYLWGHQTELGAFATSYIPNNSSAASVTRAADVAQLTGSALTTLQGSAGSAITEALTVDSVSRSRYLLNVSDNSLDNRITFSTTLSNTPGVTIVTGGVTQASIASAGTISGNVAFRAGMSFGSSASLSLNGGAIVNSSAVTLPSRTRVDFGYNNNFSGVVLNGYFRSLALYNQRLPDAILKTKSTVGAPY